MAQWKTLRSDVVYENPWMKVREDQVIRPDGKEGIYGYMEMKKIGAGIVLVNEKRQVFLQEEFRYPLQRLVLEIPGGGIEPDEDLLVGAKRELKEETGYEASEWKQLGEFFTSTGFVKELAQLYLASGTLNRGEMLDEGDSLVTGQQWIDIDEVYRRLDAGELDESYTIVGLALARQYLQPKG